MAGLAKAVVMAVFVLVAIAQIGVNTKVVDTAVAGSSDASRSRWRCSPAWADARWRPRSPPESTCTASVRPGDIVSGDGFGGVVKTVWGATVELDVDGVIVHVANSKLLAGNLTIERATAVE